MNNALTISGLTKTYKDFVLDSVSFDVPEGSIVGLIGENGAGKSTTINAVMGLIKKDAGHISIMGKEELITIPKNRSALFLTAAITRKFYPPNGSTGS